jgi:hypothetical protein
MTQRVASGMLKDAGFKTRLSESTLQNRFVKMMPAPFTGDPVDEMAARWKYPLPSPLFPRIGIFALEGVRQNDSAQAVFKIALVLLSNVLEVLSERFFYCSGKHRVPVFGTCQ